MLVGLMASSPPYSVDIQKYMDLINSSVNMKNIEFKLIVKDYVSAKQGIYSKHCAVFLLTVFD